MMSFSAKTRYLLVTGAILFACLVQAVRGYKPVIVVVAGLTFLLAGNAAVYLSGAKERAARRKQKQEYYAGLR